MKFVDNITFQFPAFTIINGLSNNGKTYFVYEGLVPEALKQKINIHYVVRNDFPIEEPLAKQAIKHKNVYIHPTDDLNAITLKNLIKIIKGNDDKKIVIIDNFSYSLTLPLLQFATYARKYNCSLIFISHTLYANPKFSPRLREAVSYFVMFYSNINTVAYKQLLGEEILDIFEREISPKSYKFMIADNGSGEYTIGKLPEYKIKLDFQDQSIGSGKLADAIRELSKRYEEKLDGGNVDMSAPLHSHRKPKKRNKSKKLEDIQPLFDNLPMTMPMTTGDSQGGLAPPGLCYSHRTATHPRYNVNNKLRIIPRAEWNQN